MRISKDPEIRKQEMIDTAMKLFAQKGYEFTSMSDIAKEMNVVSGLCYRYFKSKEELYNTAVNMYAKECSIPIINLLSQDYDSIQCCLDKLIEYVIAVDKTEKYHNFFHGSNNRLFHKQLELLMFDLILPHMISLLDKWKEKNIINIEDTKAAASFILCGQMPIIDDDSLPSDKKCELISSIILKILK